MRALFTGRDEERRRQIKEKEQMQAHSTAHSAMANQQDGLYSVQYLDKLLPDSAELDADTKELVSIMLNELWALTNFDPAEVEENKWLKRAMKKNILAFHPEQGSPIQGEYRKFIFDDPTDGLSPLTQRQKSELDQLLNAALAIDPRSRDGWQQREMTRVHQVSETIDSSESESGGLFSF